MTSDLLGAAAADLVAALRSWVSDLRFDDDQDPALDTPAQRLARAFDRCAALAGARGGRDELPRTIARAILAREVSMPPATHVLWGSHVLCEDPRLSSFPCDWPKGQRRVSLKSVSDGAEPPVDRCASCWDKAPRYIDEIKKVRPR